MVSLTVEVSRELASLLATAEPEIRTLALETREFVNRIVPGADEMIDSKARLIGYGYGPGYADTICVIMLTKKAVNLGIARAVGLPDPHGLLEGTGKRHRHVKLRRSSDLRKPGLRVLLKSAVKAWKAGRQGG